MAVFELLKPVALALCKEGKPDRIAEFKDILQDKLNQWNKAFVRATASSSNLIQAVNYLQSNAFPMNPETYQELQDFITFVNGLC
jgi:hypothetical protein